MSISGVVLLVENDLYCPEPNPGKRVVVFGQLTNGGVPLPGSEFFLGANAMGIGNVMGTIWGDRRTHVPVLVNVKRKAAGHLLGEEFSAYAIYHPFDNGFVDADGVQLHYALHSTGILGFDINRDDLKGCEFCGTVDDELGMINDKTAPRYLLTELPEDPPGEAHVAFF